MAQKETQIKYKEGEGDPNCTHPNIEYSELKKAVEQQRRDNQEMQRNQAAKDGLKKWHAMKHFDALGNAAAAADCLSKMQGSKANADGLGFEQKVADDTNAKWTSIKFKCPDCGLSGDMDVVTDEGVVKECKVSSEAASESQYNKICSAAAAIFPGSPVHMAVPAGDAAGVARKFAQDMKGKVQSH